MGLSLTYDHIQVFAIPINQEQICALRGETKRNSFANPGSRAGDDCLSTSNDPHGISAG
jgi:hypothetical protein